MKTSIAFLACTVLVTPAFADFRSAPPPPPFTDGYFECSIVRHTAERDPDPVYKINVNVASDSACCTGLKRRMSFASPIPS
jgi:hypothetical protein